MPDQAMPEVSAEEIAVAAEAIIVTMFPLTHRSDIFPATVESCERMGRAALLAAAQVRAKADPERLTIADYEEVLADKRRLTRELDVAMHGEAGAAKQASLCDLIDPARRLLAERDTLTAKLAAAQAVFRQVEWGNQGKCPRCLRYRPGHFAELSPSITGHAPDCALAAALAPSDPATPIPRYNPEPTDYTKGDPVAEARREGFRDGVERAAKVAEGFFYTPEDRLAAQIRSLIMETSR